MRTTRPASTRGRPSSTRSTRTSADARAAGGTHEAGAGARGHRGAGPVLAARARLLLPAPRHDGLRRADRARRLHAAGPGRAPALDLAHGLQGRARAGAARPRAARGATRDLPRVARPRGTGRDT